ncbi:hypothetical protein Tco_0778739 [Tanacetum coccineum]
MEIIRINKGKQGKEKQDSPLLIKVNRKVALKEFDIKSDFFKHHDRHECNRNPANYHLYHALMEALIADEMPMDMEVQIRSAKRRRPESATSGSAQPPSKDDHQSSKKPWESDASASIQHPALTSTGWQITDTRDDDVNSLMHMLPNNIQITDTSLMHMLNLNPHKKDSLVLLSEIPLLCQRRGLLIRLRSSRWEADVVSEHFDRDDNAGDDNEETKPDPEEILISSSVPLLILQSSIFISIRILLTSPDTYSSGPGHSTVDYRTQQFRFVTTNSFSTPNVHQLMIVLGVGICPLLWEFCYPSTSSSQTTHEKHLMLIPTSVEEDVHGY